MIIKSKSRKRGTWHQLLSYMEESTDERSILIAHNVRGHSADEWVQEFRENESLRLTTRKDSVQLYHEILSWHDEDKQRLTKEALEDLTLQYISLRAEKGLVVAMSHHDEDHVHVHLCISGVEHSTGRSMRVSQSQFTAIKRTVQEHQKKRYPGLAKSIADHGRKARQVRSEPEYQMKLRTREPSRRDALTSELKALFGQSRSMDTFERALVERGMELYRRNGRPQGVKADGVKYRLTAIGINKEDVERVNATPTRMQQLQRARDRASTERDAPGQERQRRPRRPAPGEPHQQ